MAQATMKAMAESRPTKPELFDMMRMRASPHSLSLWRLLATVLGLLGIAASVSADPTAVAQGGQEFPYPADALLVVSLRGIKTIEDHIHELAMAAFPKQAPPWRERISKRLATDLLKDRKVSVLRPEARSYLVIHDFGEEFSDPTWSLLLPVQSYKEFCTSFLTPTEQRTRTHEGPGVEAIRTTALAALGEEEIPVYLVDLGEYVAICSELKQARNYRGQYTRASTRALGPILTETYLQADVALYINTESLVQRYANELRAMKALLDFVLQQAEQEIPGLDQAERELMKKAIPALFQAIDDSRAVVLGLECGAKGVQCNLHIRFGENTASSRVLAHEKGLATSEWTHLPAGMQWYYAQSIQGEIGKLLVQTMQDYRAADNDSQGQKLAQLHLNDLRAAGLQVVRGAMNFPGYGLTVARYRDPEKAGRAFVKLHKVLGAGGHVQGLRLKTPPGVREGAEQHRGFTFTEIRLHFDWDEMLEEFPEAQRDVARDILRRIVPERVSVWVGLVEKNQQKELVELWASNWEQARKLLDSFLDGKETLGNRTGFAAVRDRLVDSSSMNILDLNALTPVVLNFLELIRLEQDLPPLPHKPERLDANTPAFVFVNYRCQEEVFTLQLYSTPEAVAILAHFVESILKNAD